jgi:hypothetical protein
MIYYLVPITSQQRTIGNQTISGNAPKYLSQITGAFTVVSFGLDGWGILTLSDALPSLSLEPDVYSFPSDLSTVMQSTDVSTLSAFLANANIPSDQIIAGMTFAAALQVIAKICMVNQALCGATGAKTFSEGTTLSTTIANSDLAPLASTQKVSQQVGAGVGSGGTGGGSTPPIAPQIGPFDFSSVTASITIGAMLDSISQQFTQPVNLGEF